jgi:hypothetical protein
VRGGRSSSRSRAGAAVTRAMLIRTRSIDDAQMHALN